MYLIEIGIGRSYRYNFKNIKVKEVVSHDGCIVRYGICGIIKGDLYGRCQMMVANDDDYTTRTIY